MGHLQPTVVLLFLLAVAQGCAPDAGDFDGDGEPDASDCGPADPTVFPGAADPWPDGLDQDCDGRDGVDLDADGYPSNLDATNPLRDCDDGDPSVHPGAVEVDGDGADQDCDGLDVADADGDGTPDGEDCAPADATLDTSDADGDGQTSCEGDCDDEDADRNRLDRDGDGTTSCAGDCDDLRSQVAPGAAELCDGQDGDCSGALDDAERDEDGDGYMPCGGDCDDDDPLLTPADADADGYSTCGGDCDDADPAADPADADFDGLSSCHGDCDDEDPSARPGLAEVCDGTDNDCDGVFTGEVDGDGDGWLGCEDCDDADAEAGGRDEDGDGWSACDGDCSDGNPAAYPGAPDPYGDGIDQDCAGADGLDSDGDGWAGNAPSGSGLRNCDDGDPAANHDDFDGDGTSSCAGDCDDGDPDRHPDAHEVCDGLDSDCLPDPDEVDDDGDGWLACVDCDDGDPERYPDDVDGDGWPACEECDDAAPSVFPGSLDERDGDGVDHNCDGADAFSLASSHAVLLGPSVESRFGEVVQPLGDLDGDGVSEFAVGAPQANWTQFLAGLAFIHSGAGVSLGGARLWTEAESWVFGQGFGGYLGRAMAAADVDGDGDVDLLVSEPGYRELAPDRRGRMGWIPGADLLGAGEIYVPPTGATELRGHDQANAGGALDVRGDVDGDGVADLLVGSPSSIFATGPFDAGRLSVVVGADLQLGATVRTDTARWTFEHDAENARLGSSVAWLEDLDGDGLSELAAGADGDDIFPSFIDRPGEVFVWLSSDLPATGTYGIDTASVRISGANTADLVGALVVALGDVDGDGYEDLGVGAPGSDLLADGGGELAIFSGASLLASTELGLGDAHARLGCAEADSEAGRAAAMVTDLDSDGRPELLVGAPGGAGQAFLIEGVDLLAGGVFDLSDARTHFRGTPGSAAGWAVADLGDLDGDGLPELAVGAPASGLAGPAVGAVHVVLGTP